MSKAQKSSMVMPELKSKGIDYLVGTPKAGVGIQAAQVTLSGAAPHTLTFAGMGMANMADAAYVVIAGGETAAAVKVDQSTMTATGFDLLGGANGEVVHLLIVGRISGMVDSTGRAS